MKLTTKGRYAVMAMADIALYQNGKPVQRAALSDGEFVFTNKAVKAAGGGSIEKGADAMYELMNNLEARA